MSRTPATKSGREKNVRTGGKRGGPGRRRTRRAAADAPPPTDAGLYRRRRARTAAGAARRRRDHGAGFSCTMGAGSAFATPPHRLPAVPFDPSVYLPLDAQGSLGASASGIAFATSTGDILELTSCGPGVFRVRAGPDNRPDYGIVQGHAQACTVTQPAARRLGARRRERHARDHRGAAAPAAAAPGRAGARIRAPISASTARRGCRPSAGCAAATSGPRRSRSRPASRSTAWASSSGRSTSAGSSSTPGSRTRRASTPGSAVQVRAVRLEPGRRPGREGRRLGPVRAHAGPGRARRRLSRLVASLVRAGGRRRSARPLPLRRRHARRHPRSLHAAHRPRARRCRRGASGRGWRATTTTRRTTRSRSPRRLRERRIPCDVLMLDDRVAWSGATRFDQRWDRERFPRAAAALAAIQAQGLRVCVSQSPARRRRRAVVRRAVRAGLPAVAARAACRTPAPRDAGSDAERWSEALGDAAGVRLRRLHQPGRVRVVARRARASSSPTASTR